MRPPFRPSLLTHQQSLPSRPFAHNCSAMQMRQQPCSTLWCPPASPGHCPAKSDQNAGLKTATIPVLSANSPAHLRIPRPLKIGFCCADVPAAVQHPLVPTSITWPGPPKAQFTLLPPLQDPEDPLALIALGCAAEVRTGFLALPHLRSCSDMARACVAGQSRRSSRCWPPCWTPKDPWPSLPWAALQRCASALQPGRAQTLEQAGHTYYSCSPSQGATHAAAPPAIP